MVVLTFAVLDTRVNLFSFCIGFWFKTYFRLLEGMTGEEEIANRKNGKCMDTFKIWLMISISNWSSFQNQNSLMGI